MTTIAIIGAGLCGLRLAQRLRSLGRVTVFEKSRGLGGRMSTRRAEGYAFDHGAQYFSARSDGFAAFLSLHMAEGTVAQWSPRRVRLAGDTTTELTWSAPRYVAVPGMTALAKAMAEGLELARDVQIVGLSRKDGQWQLMDRQDERHGGYDWVISTAPAPQTTALMPVEFAGHGALAQAQMAGCYSLMLGFSAPLPLDWEAAEVAEGPLGWIAMNSTKPGRDAGFSVLAQSTNIWAEANLERDQSAVRTDLVSALEDAIGQSVAEAAYVSLHRWRYASVPVPAGAPYLCDAGLGLAAAGDWCGAGKIEAAFDSAEALADHLTKTLS